MLMELFPFRRVLNSTKVLSISMSFYTLSSIYFLANHSIYSYNVMNACELHFLKWDSEKIKKLFSSGADIIKKH